MTKNQERRLLMKLVLRAVMFIFMLLIWVGIGAAIADLMIYFKVEMLSISTTGTLTIGVGGLVSTMMLDKMLDRLYDKYDELFPEEDKPSDDKPSDDKPSDDKPSDDKPSDDKPSDDKPAASSNTSKN